MGRSRTVKVDAEFNPKDAQSNIAKFKNHLSDMAQELTGFNLGTLAAGGGLVLLAKGLKDSIDKAAAAEKIQSQLNAVLTSTKGAAGLSADAINSMAAELGELNAISKNEVVSASNLMLTFTQIGKEVFPDAMQAVINISTAMGTDLKGSVIQLGKALNNPITGMSALQEVGVTFSATQKQQITDFMKVNDVMSAQKIILNELNTEFGGAGAAAATTYEGQIKNLSLAFDGMAVEVGQIAIPIVVSFLNQMKDGVEVIKLLWNWQNKLDEVYKQNDADLIKSSDGYEDYEKKIIATYLATGKLTKAEYENLIVGRESKPIARDFLQNLGMTSAFEYEAAKHTNTLTTAIKEQNTVVYSGATGWAALPPFMQGYITKANEAYSATLQNSQVVAETAARFENMKQSAMNAIQEIDNAKASLQTFGENFGTQVDNELKARGLTGQALKDAEAVIDEKFGLELGWNTKVQEAAKKVADEYASTGNLEAFKKAIDDKVTQLEKENEKLREGVELIDKQVAGMAYLSGQEWFIRIKYQIDGGIPAAPSSPWTGEHLNDAGAAGGANFIVPPGYPNDSFNLGLTSGEHAVITPANQVTNNITHNWNYRGNATRQQIYQSYEMARLLD